MQRIGIYAGTFDPVHTGHVAFALQATGYAKLDKLYFLPERKPRHKKGVEHFGHRVAMLQRAVKPHPKFHVLELDDISFSVQKTLPKLHRRFTGKQLVFLFGSDTAKQLASWPLAKQLLANCEFVIGIRSGDSHAELRKLITNWPAYPKAVTMFDSHIPSASSSNIRDSLRRREPAEGILRSVERYSDSNWLYVSVE